VKRARLAGSVLVAVVAMSLGSVSVAVATGPLFLTSGKPTFIGVSGTSRWNMPALDAEVTCTKSTATGEISSTTLAAGIAVHFLECEAFERTEKCPVMSTGAPSESLIPTVTLHGVLGLVLPRPAAGSDMGLLLLPNTGKKLFTLLASCLFGGEAATVTGSVAGLVEPVGRSVLAGTLAFAETGGLQNIRDIDLTNGPFSSPRAPALWRKACRGKHGAIDV
jgi:hypothetical protein